MGSIRDFENLLLIDEHRHFGNAAQAAGISQSALSKSLQRLEQHLGATLVERSRAVVRPTATGSEIIPQVREFIQRHNLVKEQIELLETGKLGEVTVGIGPAMSESSVVDSIAGFADEHRESCISIKQAHWKDLTSLLFERRVEFFVADITEAERDNRLICERLPPESFVWVCRSQHPLARKRTVSREQMLEFPIATPTMPAWALKWFTDGMPSRSDTCPTIRVATIECENYATLKRIVRASNCISPALESTVSHELGTREFKSLPIDAPILKTNAGIVWLQNHRLSPLAIRLIERIQNSET